MAQKVELVATSVQALSLNPTTTKTNKVDTGQLHFGSLTSFPEYPASSRSLKEQQIDQK
jgi:hypothetical protein